MYHTLVFAQVLFSSLLNSVSALPWCRKFFNFWDFIFPGKGNQGKPRSYRKGSVKKLLFYILIQVKRFINLGWNVLFGQTLTNFENLKRVEGRRALSCVKLNLVLYISSFRHGVCYVDQGERERELLRLTTESSATNYYAVSAVTST